MTGSRTESAPWTGNIPSAPRLADAATARNGLTCGGLGSMRGGCSKSRKVNCLIQPHEMRAARNSHRKRGGCRRLSTRFCWATPSTRRQCYGQTGDAPDPKRFKRSQPCASPPGRYSARWLLLDFPVVGRPRTARGCEQRCSSQEVERLHQHQIAEEVPLAQAEARLQMLLHLLLPGIPPRVPLSVFGVAGHYTIGTSWHFLHR